MEIKKTEEYRRLFNKLDCIGKGLLKTKGTNKDKRLFTVCLAEIHFWSNQIINLIETISEKNLDLDEDGFDELLGNLVYLQIIIYGEIIDWMKALKRPLQKVVDAVSEEAPDTDDNEQIFNKIISMVKRSKVVLDKIDKRKLRKPKRGK